MKKIFHKQGFHLLAALILSGAIWIAAGKRVLAGSWLGFSTTTWLVLAVVLPVLHQFYVAVCWRAELHHGWLSRLLGRQAFPAFGVGFMILFLSRPVTILALGFANQGTLPIPLWLNLPLVIICLVLVVYLTHSFLRYFGARRALGEDHFRPDNYRRKPFIRQGIFKWSSNAMYTYGFLALWGIGLVMQSRAALLAAAFNHIFIWAHFFFTEQPDMQDIYAKQ